MNKKNTPWNTEKHLDSKRLPPKESRKKRKKEKKKNRNHRAPKKFIVAVEMPPSI